MPAQPNPTQPNPAQPCPTFNMTPSHLLKSNTVKNYLQMFSQLRTELIKIHSHGEEELPVQFDAMTLVHHIEQNPLGHKIATVRLRRSALMYVLNNIEEKDEASIQALEYLGKNVKMENAIPGKGTPNSRNPGRMIPVQDYIKIIDQLEYMRKKWGVLTLAFLQSTVASGCRPAEWVKAKWTDKEKTHLRVFNSKVKNINAWDKVNKGVFGEDINEEDVRRIPDIYKAIDIRKHTIESLQRLDLERRLSLMPDLPEPEKNELRDFKKEEGNYPFRDVFIEPEFQGVVDQHLQNAQAFFRESIENYDPDTTPDEIKGAAWNDIFYSRCRTNLYRACKAVFDDNRTYSLYDGRSTFSACRKATQGVQKTSEELGHTSRDSSSKFYAKSAEAWSTYKKTGVAPFQGVKLNPTPEHGPAPAG